MNSKSTLTEKIFYLKKISINQLRLYLKILLSVFFIVVFSDSIRADDLIFTIIPKCSEIILPIDSIRFINLNNGETICFSNLPLEGNFQVNLTKEIVLDPLKNNIIKSEKEFYVIENMPGTIKIGSLKSINKNVQINIFNVHGQKIYTTTFNDISLNNRITIKMDLPGVFIINILSNNNSQSFKAIGNSNNDKIYINSSTYNNLESIIPKSLNLNTEDFSFQTGDSLKVTVYKNGYYSSTQRLKVIGNNTLIFNLNLISNLISDIDSNFYKTITIGDQVWLSENLKTTRFNDGADIPLVNDIQSWYYLKVPGYNWYQHDSSFKDKYGALYNWYTVNTGKLCPVGWHVPKDYEWINLEVYLQNHGYNYDKQNDNDDDRYTNNKIAKALAVDTLWKNSDDEGAVGNDLSTNNSSGFNGIPAGFCNNMLSSNHMGESAIWWSASEYDVDNALSRDLTYSNNEVERPNMLKTFGLSVRCILDPPAETSLPIIHTKKVSSIMTNYAISGGNITNDGGFQVTTFGIVWSKDEKPTVDHHEGITNDGSGIGQYSSPMTNLLDNTIYHVRAYANNQLGISYGEELIFTTAKSPNCTIFDIDGNGYTSVDIGTQTWLAENLKTTRFNDGTPITLQYDNKKWCTENIPAYTWYADDSTNKNIYGGLYNWFATNSDKICPVGYHVPTDSEWSKLEIHLENSGFNYDGSIDSDNDRATNNKIAKALASQSLWQPGVIPGTIGGDLSLNNKTGFNALPGGYRDSGAGDYILINSIGVWWCNTESSSVDAWYRSLVSINFDLGTGRMDKNSGASIRCLKNE
jgi:uncharacterized protein (TIGR02145 family)